MKNTWSLPIENAFFFFLCVSAVEININGGKDPGEKSQIKAHLAKLRDLEDALWIYLR